MNKISKVTILILLFLIIFLNSCKKVSNNSKIRNIFKMNIGYSENDIGLFFKNDVLNQDNINVFYRSGFYYISDNQNNKIIKTTENGVHILIIYNPENNPNLKPTKIENINISDNTNDQQDKIVYVKLYKNYPIYSPGIITSDIEKNIYVVNNHYSYKKTDEAGNIVNSLILKFDNKGNFLFKIGKEGIDTMPFSYIKKMVTDQNNNLIILESTINGDTIIYKFSQNGILKTKLSISKKDIPTAQNEKDLLIDIINIIPGYIDDEIYITCQYVKEIEESLGVKYFETEYEKILKYSIKSKKIIKVIHKITPKVLNLSEIKKNNDFISRFYGDKKEVTKPFENLIGLDTNGNIYFSQFELPLDNLDKNKQKLFIYNKKGIIKDETLIDYPIDAQYISDFILSPEGKIFFYYVIDGVIQFVTINK